MHCNVVRKKSRLVADSQRNIAGKFAVSRSLSSSIFSSKDIEYVLISQLLFFSSQIHFYAALWPHTHVETGEWVEKKKKSEQRQRAMVSFSRLERSRERRWKKLSAQVSRLGRGELNIFTTQQRLCSASKLSSALSNERQRPDQWNIYEQFFHRSS